MAVTDQGGADPDPPVTARSFDAFYDRQYAPAVRLAMALVGRWSVAEELAQDAFATLFQRWKHVSQYESPEAWIRLVVVNRSVSALRRRAVEARLLLRLRDDHSRDVELPASDLELWRLVAALPKRQAQVTALTYIEGQTAVEVGAVLGCDENTVRTHLRRARVALAAQLGTSVEEES